MSELAGVGDLKRAASNRGGSQRDTAASYHAMVRRAWLEWRLNASTRGTPPDALEVDPPAWFAREELGFAAEHGPSLRETFATLTTRNARAARLLGSDAPWRLTLTKTATPTRRSSARKPREARSAA